MRNLLSSIGISAVVCGVALAQELTPPYIFTTLAGKAGTPDFVDGPGELARFKSPAKLAIDAQGNLYVADRGNGAVRKISPAGVVTTLAGIPSNASISERNARISSVVDGVGEEVRFGLSGLNGIAVDTRGNVAVSDLDTTGFGSGSSQIGSRVRIPRGFVRTVSPSGVVTTLAGGTEPVVTLVQVAGSTATTYQYSGNYDATGRNAIFDNPTNLVFDRNANIFVVDGSTVRKVTPEGVVTTFVGRSPTVASPILGSDARLESVDGSATTAKFINLHALAMLPTGEIMATDGGLVRLIATNGDVTTIAGSGRGYDNIDGVGRSAWFGAISAVAVDAEGNAYFADALYSVIRRMSVGRYVATVGGKQSVGGFADGMGSVARFFQPTGIAVDTAGNIYVADTGSHTIRKGVPAVAPKIQTQPQSYALTPGQNVALLVAATGFPAPTFQWSKDGVVISGATGTSLTLSNPQVADAGRYTVTVTNAAGTVISDVAVIGVGSGPVVSTQPLAQSVQGGQGVTLSVTASGTPAPTFQWRKDGVAIPGATSATLTVSSAQAGDAGSYTVVVTNAAGSVTSSAAVVTVNTSRIVNLSIRSTLAAGGSLTVGFVVAGNGKPLLVRCVGPGLAQFGVGGTVVDPRLAFYAGSTLVTNNDNWGGAANAAQIVATSAQIGAFALPAGSLDAALLTTLDGGGYSVQVSGAGGDGGIALVELYDANNTTAARLANVSARTQVGAGESALFAGFVVAGNAKRKVLIRAIGPTLGAFGVNGALADTRVDLIAAGASAPMAGNNDWGGGAELAAAFGAVGAFPLAADTKDAALLVTLDPGSYTVQVSGVGGLTGEALVEIYEVP